MGVSSTHDEYDVWRPTWERCRDVSEGKDALVRQCLGSRYWSKSSNLTERQYAYLDPYIPRLGGQSDSEYRHYLLRASYFNAFSRTVDAMSGMVFAKPPQIELPVPLNGYQDDITLTGCGLREFAQQVTLEEVTTTRVGILVDYPAVDTSSLSRADVEVLNIRPFLRHYGACDIINWRVGVVGGARVLTMVVLKEHQDVSKDEFTVVHVPVYRVLDLTERGYRMRVMDEDGVVLSEVYPLMNGLPMGFIPFLIVGGAGVRKPMMLDLADINLDHWRNSADMENGLHFLGAPQPYVAGVQLQEGQTLSIGSTSAWILPDPQAKAEYLEFRGQGLDALANAMAAKERRMAVLGARMLAEERRAPEAEKTLELKTAGERSLLAATAYDVSDGIRRALEWMAMWVGVSPEGIKFSLNTEFGAHRMDPQMLTAMVQAVQSDLMPLSVFFQNLKSGELVKHDLSYDEYEDALREQGPMIASANESAERTGIIGAVRQRMGI